MIRRFVNEKNMIVIIAIFAVLFSFAHMDAGASFSGETNTIHDLGHDYSAEQHAHGCGTCHFHAHIQRASSRVDPATSLAGFWPLSLEKSPQAHIGPLLRPPSA